MGQSQVYISQLANMNNLTLRVPIFFAAAAANHIALYLPSPDLTIWEQEVLKDMRVQSPSNGSMWMKGGVWTCKTIMWLGAAYEIIGYVVKEHPLSFADRQLSFWVSPNILDLFRDAVPTITLQTTCGVLLLSLGALLHISAHRSLGHLAYFPLIAKSSLTGRQLYVPPTYSHTRDALGRAQLPERSSTAKIGIQWTLRPEHELITTGPYRAVRHPMHAGALLALFGSVLIHLSPGSAARTLVQHFDRSSDLASGFSVLPDAGRGIIHTWSGVAGLALGLTFGCVLVGAVVGLVRMARREDEALAARFGHQWTVYRWSVRACVVPGLL